MKKIILFTSVMLWAALALIGSAPLWAAPVEVTFFPQSAQVNEVSKLPLKAEGKGVLKAVFQLPGTADPDTLTTRLADGSPLRIADVSWRSLTRQDEERIKELRKQLQAQKAERANLQSTLQSLDAQIAFWQAQAKAKMKTLPDTQTLAMTLGRSVKKVYQDRYALEPDIEKIDKKIKELQDELNRAAGKKDTAWEVTVLLSGSPATEATLRYDYRLAGCGWQPLYRLEARPRDRQVRFLWEGELWQSSGVDWTNVQVNVATLQPTHQIAPPDLAPWVIAPRPEAPPKPKAAGAAARKMAVEKADQQEVAFAMAPAPQEVRQSTFSLWQLGAKNLAAGIHQKMTIREEIWSVDFLHLLRPAVSNKAFLRAALKLPEPQEIPPGTALFMVDGALVGKRSFSFAGQEGFIFFGIDPLVVAKMELQGRQSGEKTLFTDRQTHHWEWRMEVLNNRATATQVRVEESRPQPRDERIRLTLKQDPPPTEQTTQQFVWTFDLAAGEKKILSTDVRLEAPKDLSLDLGR